VHVLLEQKSLKKLKGAHFLKMVQRPANTARCGGPHCIRGRLKYKY